MPGESHARRKGFAGSPGMGGLERHARRNGPRAAAFRLSRAEERRMVAAARRGDRRALSRLLALLSPPIHRFGVGFCGDPHDAEEVTQAVLVALARTLPEFRGDSSLTTWAYTVARRACARHRRRRAGAPARLESLDIVGMEREPLAVADPRQDPQRALERAELARALEHAIHALPAAQREVLMLRDVEGLAAREVGEALGLNERAVKSRLHRARVALRAVLAPWAEGRITAAPPAAGAPHAGCPDTVRLVSRYLEGELSAEACEELQRHVIGCPDCGVACETLRVALGACRAWRGRPVPAEIRSSIRTALRELVIPGTSAPSRRAARARR